MGVSAKGGAGGLPYPARELIVAFAKAKGENGRSDAMPLVAGSGTPIAGMTSVLFRHYHLTTLLLVAS